MDQQPDHAAVVRLAERLCVLPAMSWSAHRTASWPAIEGGSFRVRFWSVPDRIGDGIQLYVYFDVTDGVQRDRTWLAWVRCEAQGRDDRVTGRLATRLRKAFVPSELLQWERSTGSTAAKAARTAHWWVSGRRREEQQDVVAQIWVFLLQTGIVCDDSVRGAANAWLWEYLERNFSLRPEESWDVLEALLNRYWRPPSGGSWRAYVRACVYWHPDRIGSRRSYVASPSPDQNGSDRFTVSEASQLLKVADSTLYEWIRVGRVKAVSASSQPGRPKPIALISRVELEHLKVSVRPKLKELIELRQLVADSSYEAARKWIRRQLQRGLGAADLLQQLRTSARQLLERNTTVKRTS